ncbi:MAG: tetratricopeptide repeat protein [Bacteroidetes bacterium]|nr:MAG: tetratricopeptide repeat protein [Bacteroidota bacterium]MBL1145890.1 tetratricopeptide repeat protein [Bacteroidota bacterium]MCB0801922.1 tetratricopeptide repeat protein [Flavobacteriales bacterium]NOG58684.1 tetratricopeptide repeat protein [Bacteroidota bacterium]
MKNTVYILILFLLFSCGNEKEEQQKEPEQNKEIISQVEDTTFKAINNKIRNDIQNADLYIERANMYIDMNDFESAKFDLDRAYHIDTTALNPLLAFAEYWMKQGKLGYSLSVLEKTEQRYPKSSRVYEKYSELYLYGQDVEKSLRYADLAVKYDIYNAKAYYLKGYNFMLKGDTTRAISSYQTAVEQDPDFFEAYVELGLIYAAKNDPLAIQYYNNALSIKPDDFSVLYSRGMYEQEHEMYNEAIQTYYLAKEKFPNRKEAHFNLGYIHLYYLKLYREGTKYFTDAIEVDPKYIQAYYNRGYCFELMGDIANAEKDYRYALKIDPTYTNAALGLERVTSNL